MRTTVAHHPGGLCLLSRFAAALAGLALAVAPAAFAQPAPAPAPPGPQPQAGDFVIRDFHFQSGESLPELRIHYTTFGEPRRDGEGHVTNAVLIMHGTGGAGTSLIRPEFAGELIGPGQLLDATKYFLIFPDDIGHGKSSKPSDGLKAHFPHYDYTDMVTAQHQLLTDGLQVNHLLIVMGTSMGGMHTWMWGEMYPDFMDGLMPLASLPGAMSGRNRMMRRMMKDDITGDPDYNGGDYTTQPRGLAAALQLMFMMTSSPRQLQKQAPTTAAADAYIERWQQRVFEHEDANDYLYAFEASRDYDPSPHLDRIVAPLIAINSADDQVNPPDMGVMEALMPNVKHGQYVLIPISDKTRGHGTHTMAAIWQSHLADLLAEIRQATGR
ncbi:MAG TPA: alpha/beta fold hydrolase [Gemmatimonadaceae bacterium]